jgi:hypothetical protein
MHKSTNCFLIFFALLFLLSCSSQEQKKAEEIAKTFEKEKEGLLGGLKKASEALEGIGKDVENKDNVEIVGFRELKEVLPEKFKGGERLFKSGENTEVMGFKISSVKADYKIGDSGEINLTVSDGGGVSAAKLALAAWTMIKVDKETANGYERTSLIDGDKAYEKYDSRSKRGEVSVLINDRFLVSAKGRNVEMDDILDLLDDINKRKLGRLAN